MNSEKYLKILKDATKGVLFLLVSFFFFNNHTAMAFHLNKPDFAFPESVITESKKELSSASKNHDYPAMIRLAYDIVLAEDQISNDDICGRINFLDSLKRDIPTPYKSIVNLIQASLLTEFYENRSYLYNHRSNNLANNDIVPDNPGEWNKTIFAEKVRQLIKEGYSEIKEDGKNIPLEKISSLVDSSIPIEDINMTIYDFYVLVSATKLRVFNNSISSMSIPFFKNENREVSPSEKCNYLAKEMLESLLVERESPCCSVIMAMAVEKMYSLLPHETQADFINKWRTKLADREGYALLVTLINNNLILDQNPESIKNFYSELINWKNKFESSILKDNVLSMIDELSEKEISASIPSLILPGERIGIESNIRNLNEGYLLLYKVPEKFVDGYGNLKWKNISSSITLIQTIALNSEGEIPFENCIKSEIEPLQEGAYILIPSETPKLSKDWHNHIRRWSFNSFRVTNISILTSFNRRQEDSGAIYVVDARNQKPIEGAEVIIINENSRQKEILKLKTDKEGKINIKPGCYSIEVTYGKSKAFSNTCFYFNNQENIQQRKIKILTDLSVYKPGDKLRFAVISYNENEREPETLPNENIKMSLYDVNNKEVGTININTDRFGRGYGELDIPTDCLTGRFRLAASFLGLNQEMGMISEERERYYTSPFKPEEESVWVTVKEYKSPEFYISIEKSNQNEEDNFNSISFEGYVKTFSGLPLGMLEVDYNIEFLPWRFPWFNADKAVYSSSVTTDPDGLFKISLPLDNLRGTIFESGRYKIGVSTTSPSGETIQSSPLVFYIGKYNEIRAEMAPETLIDCDSVKFNVAVFDAMSHPIRRIVNYTIKQNEDNHIVGEGSFVSPSLILPAGLFKGGEYDFEFHLEDDTTQYNYSTIIYRLSDRKPPIETPLWLPQKNIIAPENSDIVKLMVGSSYENSWVLCIISDETGIKEERWININDENKEIIVTSPAFNQKIWVDFIGMHNFKTKWERVEITNESLLKKLEVKIETIRDKTAPGVKESWHFKFIKGHETIDNVAAFAVMTDKAINKIEPFVWNFNPGMSAYWSTDVQYKTDYERRFLSDFSNSRKSPRYIYPNLELQTYGLKMFQEVFYSRNLTNSSMMKMSNANINTTEEYALETDEQSVAGGIIPNEEDNSEPIRELEMPVAFFKPDLCVDDGVLEINVDMPEVNTTWQFQLLGYTNQMETALLVKDIVSAKPVICMGNYPSFVRTGDDLQISGMVFNNSDSTLNISGKIEIINPITKEILAVSSLPPCEIFPSGNKTINLTFKTGDDISELECRLYAYSEQFTDSERYIISVLPSSTPVVEGHQFYLSKDQKELSFKMPKTFKDSKLTLKYCDNAVWEALLSMPSFEPAFSNMPLDISTSIFANMMGQAIVNDYTFVREGLVKLFDDNNGTFITSNLENDEELKIKSINQSPWLNDAENENSRRNRLKKLLNEEEIYSYEKELSLKLKMLQNQDGGWGWFESMKSSRFITAMILLRLGEIKVVTPLSSEIESLARNAVYFCDNDFVKTYKEKDDFPTVELLNYLIVRRLFNFAVKEKKFQTMTERLLKEISSNWRRLNISNKAKAAMLLNNSGNYPNEVTGILESLVQYASKDKIRGWSFENLSSGYNGETTLETSLWVLKAFHEIEPASPAVDGLLQWILLQKETEDWGGSNLTTAIISTMLECIGSNVGINGGIPEIYISGKKIQLPVQAIPGLPLSLPLNANDVEGKEMKIIRESMTPAWGGVVNQFVLPIEKVKESKSGNISVSKKIIKKEDLTTDGNKLQMGDKVQVVLTIVNKKDMEYVVLADERCSALTPCEWISGYTDAGDLFAYRETGKDKTTFFIEFLPKGTHIITYDCFIDRSGSYTLGIATVQSLYSPIEAAHSGGSVMKIGE